MTTRSNRMKFRLGVRLSSLELSLKNDNEAKAHRLQVNETGEEAEKTRESAVELEHVTCVIS